MWRWWVESFNTSVPEKLPGLSEIFLSLTKEGWPVRFLVPRLAPTARRLAGVPLHCPYIY